MRIHSNKRGVNSVYFFAENNRTQSSGCIIVLRAEKLYFSDFNMKQVWCFATRAPSVNIDKAAEKILFLCPFLILQEVTHLR